MKKKKYRYASFYSVAYLLKVGNLMKNKEFLFTKFYFDIWLSKNVKNTLSFIVNPNSFFWELHLWKYEVDMLKIIIIIIT